MTRKVLTELCEIHKPSALCQTVFYENSKHEPLAYLPAIQIDLVNTLIYLIWEQINTRKQKYTTTTDSIQSFDIELKAITDMLEKYQKDYTPIIQLLIDLQKYVVKINMLDKDSSFIKKSSIVLIPKISWSEENGHVRKTVKIWFDSEILNFFVKQNKVFAKLYLKIQFSFVSKYSKLLYEILKDYEKVGNTITFDNLILLLNVKTEGTKNAEWSSFRPHILEKAIDEINEKADIQVSYESIKERPSENDRLQVTKVRFNVEKQPNSRLIELGLVQPTIENNKYYNKSKIKLDKLIKNGYKVIDEEKWIESDINKNTERYDAEIRIDSWVQSTDVDSKKHIFELIARSVDYCEDPTVCIDDYKIVGLFSRDAFTKNPQETIEFMNNVIKDIS